MLLLVERELISFTQGLFHPTVFLIKKETLSEIKKTEIYQERELVKMIFMEEMDVFNRLSF